MFEIVLKTILSLIFVAAPAQNLSKVRDSLDKPKASCVQYLARYNINYKELISFGRTIKFYDGHKSLVTVQGAKILPYSKNKELLRDYILRVAPDAGLVASIDGKAVYIYDEWFIKDYYLIHEYLHIYLKLDDRGLAAYLNLKTKTHSIQISKTLKKYCKK